MPAEEDTSGNDSGVAMPAFSYFALFPAAPPSPVAPAAADAGAVAAGEAAASAAQRPPCEHLTHWVRLRSRKAAADFRCGCCRLAFTLSTSETTNVGTLALVAPEWLLDAAARQSQSEDEDARPGSPAVVDLASSRARQWLRAPPCGHVQDWERLRRRSDAWCMRCRRCLLRFNAPNPNWAPPPSHPGVTPLDTVDPVGLSLHWSFLVDATTATVYGIV